MTKNERTGSNADAPTIRVALYARVATDGDFSALSAQIGVLREHVEEIPQYIVGEVYSERGEPATGKGEADLRPEYLRLLADARGGRVDLVLATRMSGFSGSVTNMLEAVRGLLECGVGVKFLDERVHFVRSIGGTLLTTFEEVNQDQVSWRSRSKRRALALVEDFIRTMSPQRSERAG